MTDQQRDQSKTLGEHLRAFGVTRRGFLKFCTATASMMALPPSTTPAIAQALEKAKRPTVIWLSFQECTGCTESLTRSHAPSVENLIFDYISLAYHHTLQAASGEAAEAAREEAMRESKGHYLVVVDGSIPLNNPGYSTIAGISNQQMLEETVKDAAAVIAVGSCAAFGGLPHADPNPTGAVSVADLVSDVPVVNISGCPPIPTVITGVLAHYLTFGTLPELDELKRPRVFYGQSIHDRCYRRPFYDKGLFAQTFDDEGARKGWCLYRLGCKGPMTYNACATAKWNQGTSWPVESGHGCLGCSEPNFWDAGGFYNALSIPDSKVTRHVSYVVGAGVALGAAAGAINRATQAKAANQHETVTIDDLDKTS
jgi:hydrogenase small subunit